MVEESSWRRLGRRRCVVKRLDRALAPLLFTAKETRFECERSRSYALVVVTPCPMYKQNDKYLVHRSQALTLRI